jgi:hypothetical protein
MKNLQHYTFTFVDADGNNTEQRTYKFYNIKEARKHAFNLLANAMDDTAQIIVKFSN